MASALEALLAVPAEIGYLMHKRKDSEIFLIIHDFSWTASQRIPAWPAGISPVVAGTEFLVAAFTLTSHAPMAL